ncbi:MAG: hypothetical protein KJO76_06370 [Gammaproteobacteria bacterium]|nr:hypothetical protein [Gammaproteobacteria bacterium]MBT8445044.1 hypothetical protein [Gammaproteobacteria bacterium]
MSSNETSLELEKLRAEVAALRAAKEEAATESDEPAAASTAPSPPESSRSDEGPPKERLKSQLEELTDLLEDEVRDLPTITTLAVFTAGVLLGRFLR